METIGMRMASPNTIDGITTTITTTTTAAAATTTTTSSNTPTTSTTGGEMDSRNIGSSSGGGDDDEAGGGGGGGEASAPGNLLPSIDSSAEGRYNPAVGAPLRDNVDSGGEGRICGEETAEGTESVVGGTASTVGHCTTTATTVVTAQFIVGEDTEWIIGHSGRNGAALGNNSTDLSAAGSECGKAGTVQSLNGAVDGEEAGIRVSCCHSSNDNNNDNSNNSSSSSSAPHGNEHENCGYGGGESKNSRNETIIVAAEDGQKTPVQPKFCVQGSGEGDSSVTVVALAALSGNTLVDVVDFDGGSGETSCCHAEGEDNNSVAGSGSAPLSVQSSEDMKLSLVSWCSEPVEPSRDCCQSNNNLISRAIATVAVIGAERTKLATDEEPAEGEEHELRQQQQQQQQQQLQQQQQQQQQLQQQILLDIHDKSDEKENKTPMRSSTKSVVSSVVVGSNQRTPSSQRLKMHVQLNEQNSPCVENGKGVMMSSAVGGGLNGSIGSSSRDAFGHGKKVECPRCARRSKSGTTTPAAPSRTPRRIVQSSKSTQELKKPIKSILKSDSRSGGSRSGSGSEKQSSMDSLGSASGISCIMTRSDGCTATTGGRTKFSFQNSSFSSTSLSPDDKNTAAKLKRIEKYATLRLKKPRVRPSEVDCGGGGGGGGGGGCVDGKGGEHHGKNHVKQSHGTVGGPGVNPEMMSKSMSFLEKSSHHHHHHHHHNNPTTNTGLKRQGSLRLRKPSPMWEPSGTRTSALRMQKVQEAKAKTTGKGASGSHSGSNHSGSGESIHVLSSAANPVTSNGHSHHSHSLNGTSNSSTNTSYLRSKEKHPQHHHHHQQQQQQHSGAKVFTKLSSASGQTTSSAMKRIRQERGVQTEPLLHTSIGSPTMLDGHSPTRMSPLPALDSIVDESDNVKRLETLVQRYRAAAQRFQQEAESSEERNRELQRQLQETQSETNEMVEFLQAEKSLLAESLAEAESEGKKWQEQVESVKKEAQSRCSSLVRLSEQHKQEALKAQALLHRLEVQSNAMMSKQSADMSEAALGIQQTRNRTLSLIEKLVKTYKVSHELISAGGMSSGVHSTDDAELNSSLLVPLITALLHAYPSGEGEEVTPTTPEGRREGGTTTNNPLVTMVTVGNGLKSTGSPKTSPTKSDDVVAPAVATPVLTGVDGYSGDSNMIHSSSLQNLNQAILDREAAEQLGQDELLNLVEGGGLDSINDGDHLCLKTEIKKLNEALLKLVTVIRVIVIYCDKKVSGVTSNILQCLRSIEDDKVGAIPEMVHVQKSLEAWKDSTQCKQNGSAAGKVSVENGHS